MDDTLIFAFSQVCYPQEQNSKKAVPDSGLNSSSERQRPLSGEQMGWLKRPPPDLCSGEKNSSADSKLEQACGTIGSLWPQWLPTLLKAPARDMELSLPHFQGQVAHTTQGQSKGPHDTATTIDCSWGLLLFKGSLLLG